MNTQEFFNTTTQHLLTQGRRAQEFDGPDDDDSQCRYRVVQESGTLKCAIGCHIPDELYDPQMEGLAVSALMKAYPALAQQLSSVDRELMRAAQLLHDNDPPSEWRAALKQLAGQFNLIYREPALVP